MDTGLHSLVAIARFHQLPAEPEQLAHQFSSPGTPFSDTELLLAAKALTLKAKKISPPLSKLENAILPAIAKTRDGNYFILARIAKDETEGDQASSPAAVLIHDLRESAPRSVSVEEFESLWEKDSDNLPEKSKNPRVESVKV